MMIRTKGNLLEAQAEALVNTVNEVGVMGKGIALMFREAFPEAAKSYIEACKRNEVRVGRMLVTETGSLVGPKWIIHFPTKRHWRRPSCLEWIREGLADLVRVLREKHIRSVAVPPLGCGNGGLDWSVVKSEIEATLGELNDVDVLVFAPTEKYQNQPEATSYGLTPNAVVQLVVLAPKEAAARCRVLGTESQITFRCRPWDLVSGEIVTVRVRKEWQYAGHPYLSGDVESSRLDVKELGLVPLELQDEWPWDPDEEYWGEEDEPPPEWAKPIIARGRRPSFEMEQVLPGADPDDWDSDPILEAADLCAAGRGAEAHDILVGMLAADLRCLDAHAHLGNLVFEHFPEKAIRHYEAGMRIGELSLGDAFDGVLPWGLIDNRPFLRCMKGYGLCSWRLNRHAEAADIFERMLWLNPSDNQGVRFLLPAVRNGRSW